MKGETLPQKEFVFDVVENSGKYQGKAVFNVRRFIKAFIEISQRTGRTFQFLRTAAMGGTQSQGLPYYWRLRCHPYS